MPSSTQIIQAIIDKHLQKQADAGLNRIPLPVAPAMADLNQAPNEEWRIWHAIPSTATEEDIAEVESQIGHVLPSDFKVLLHHKHYYELWIPQLRFCAHPVDTWKTELLALMLEAWGGEGWCKNGYIPFAEWADSGVLCFDTHAGAENANYPVVFWDHEFPDEVTSMAEDFLDLLQRLDTSA